MTVKVCTEAFDPAVELQRYEQGMRRTRGKFGATVSFTGTLRDFNDGDAVQSMTLEHYAGMTEKYLETVSAEARARWDVLDTLIIHRVGALLPGEPIVLVTVWAAHRAAAFDACRYLIEELKSRAPFWKKEQLTGGARWVERNTPRDE
jgi:molybdopterin synthase catalytic subunit